MNEELKIIIRAITSEAEKNMRKVRQELEGVEAASQKTGKMVDNALRGIGKGAVVAVSSVVALTTAINALGKSSLEYYQIQTQLVAGFQSMGLSADTAKKTFEDLYVFLGERYVDNATEAASQLAQLTQNTEHLAQWTDILQGVYASFSRSLPVEILAEAANETANTGKIVGGLADALNWAGYSEEAFQAQLDKTTTMEEREALIRETLNGLYANASKIYARNNRALIEYNRSQMELDRALADAMTYVLPLMTNLAKMASVALTALKPAFETVTAVLIAFVQWVLASITAIGTFFGMFGETKSAVDAMSETMEQVQQSTAATTENFGDAGSNLQKANKEAEKLKRQLMGFDELNVISPQSSSSGDAGSGSNIPAINIPNLSEGLNVPDLEAFEEKVATIKSYLEGIVPLVLTIGAGLLAWKLASILNDFRIMNMSIKDVQKAFGKDWTKVVETASWNTEMFMNKLKLAGAAALTTAGAVAVIVGFSDAWVNGIDWGNFALILGGVAAIMGGLAIQFGATGAAIGLALGGVVAIVIGIKDLVTNGYSLQSVLIVLAGAVAVLVGVLWAFNAALLANPITWIVVGIMALVAAFVILWNECEGFRNFWIQLWEKVKVAFNQFIDTCRPLFDAIGNAFKELWELIKVIWGYVVADFKNSWEDIKVIWNGVKPYFELIWNGIKTTFSVVKTILGGYFKVAWETIKATWSVVVSYFTMIFNNIASAFSAVRKILTGDFKGAWEDIKKIFSNVGTFFQSVVDTIKRLFGNIAVTVATTISNTVKTAINGLLSNAVRIINGFISAINFAIGVINAIPGVNIGYLEKLSVPKLATGGITTGATLAMIGERGKEAVLPLENNTEWMDTLADKIANRNSGPSQIILELDGKALGWASIRSINDITRQTGRLQLATV